jgi:hypothetical protein
MAGGRTVCRGWLAGCSVGPRLQTAQRSCASRLAQRPEQRESIANLGWWQLFEDPTLQQLIGAALVANNDVQVAVAWVGASVKPNSIGVSALHVVLDKGQEDDWFGSSFITTLTIVAGVCLI